MFHHAERKQKFPYCPPLTADVPDNAVFFFSVPVQLVNAISKAKNAGITNLLRFCLAWSITGPIIAGLSP
jgi:hypothetical protein